MKTLVIVHLEPDFLSYIPDNLPERVATYAKLFDRVIVIESASELSDTDPFWELRYFYECGIVYTWVWGWPDGLDYNRKVNNKHDKEGETYIVCKHSLHPGAYIPYWIHNLDKSDKYYLVGGGASECLADMKEMFDYFKFDNRVVESLTY